MTKDLLLKKNIKLEEELHVAHNSIEYWREESEAYMKLYRDLEQKTESDIVSSFLLNCSIIEKQKLEDFIQTLMQL